MDTKTYEDWSKYLGVKPHRLGVVARMYTDNTLNFITDGLRNIFYKDENVDKFQLSNSLMFEWEVEQLIVLTSNKNSLNCWKQRCNQQRGYNYNSVQRLREICK